MDLVGAVRAQDAEAVRELLDAGADPDTVGEDGLPVLCVAVAAYAVETVRALVEGGADPDRLLPDGTTPLLRAVEGGSPAVVDEVLGRDPRLRLPEVERGRLLDAARRWYEAGAEVELRRLTGALGPARTRIVLDGESDLVEEVTLGGRTVRAGHGAVLTHLEWQFRILAPVGELVARAVRYGDEDHVDRQAARWILVLRRSAETWSAVVEYHRHPSPAHRAFVAEFLSLGELMSGVTLHDRWYRQQLAVLLPDWADVEPDGGVLARVLGLLRDQVHPQTRAFGLRYAAHPDRRVRRRIPRLFDEPLDPMTAQAVRDLGRDPDGGVRAVAAETLGREDELGEHGRTVMLALLRDGDPEVRRSAAYGTGRGRDCSPEIVEELVALLGSDDQDVRLSAAYGLAGRDDPRTPQAYARVGPLGPELEGDPRADGLWRWRVRNEPTG
ncbi:HEAT repeat domain-containing protein [Streptomyces sp. NPDC088762]|uniref:HEAT repeat domain-containing protein n=1 Tax=Streptomyces sp. NPDC088762 TaxID=3365891 RepID=UPI0037FF26DD